MIDGTDDIYYETDKLSRTDNMVYVTLNNRNAQALKKLDAKGLVFTAAFYCNKRKVRTLSKTIYYNDGFIDHNADNSLEANPETDALNETPDLLDMDTTPDLMLAFSFFCK